MRTKKEVSTISYNSFPYLQHVLADLIEEGIISDYMFIRHEPEEDEKKRHIHLWIRPNKLVDTVKLQKRFIEPNMIEPDKPYKCIDFRVSDSDNWILYNLHYKPYLLSKGESRKYEYSVEDFVFYDYDNFEFLYAHALKGSEWSKQHKLVEELNQGFSVYELIRSGRIPFNLSSQGLAFEKMQRRETYRNGRLGHE